MRLGTVELYTAWRSANTSKRILQSGERAKREKSVVKERKKQIMKLSAKEKLNSRSTPCSADLAQLRAENSSRRIPSAGKSKKEKDLVQTTKSSFPFRPEHSRPKTPFLVSRLSFHSSRISVSAVSATAKLPDLLPLITVYLLPFFLRFSVPCTCNYTSTSNPPTGSQKARDSFTKRTWYLPSNVQHQTSKHNFSTPTSSTVQYSTSRTLNHFQPKKKKKRTTSRNFAISQEKSWYRLMRNRRVMKNSEERQGVKRESEKARKQEAPERIR